MLSRKRCCMFISPYLQTKSVGGLHVNLSDWLGGSEYTDGNPLEEALRINGKFDCINKVCFDLKFVTFPQNL
jgi:hypothetical protein